MATDELQAYGVREMSDDEIEAFLSVQTTGVLGLPDDAAPYLLPISYGYDGDRRLYFTYLEGAGSRKTTLSERADAASFLCYAVDTLYNWESALLSGSLNRVPESSWDEIDDHLADVWRPALLEDATLSGEVSVFEFRVDDWTGLKHQGLPPALEPSSE
ncbi:pyridoxamine 5'-phosphate oxidase family protein [Natronolimnohabitans innermongolicus]|uniref:Flavin-nucleotide-binding protein-like protein n=1 Tax=Natronolimnohabitans innermongolicus JCM 12255 TaxID=1227499 RepID=L9XAB7_9EURY|nr:pyridoxamine 5'-phosphate oxidase family protein [Natronolimnohabitans innermongolicus]ELY58699.1 flavin-nucleotide-binding protein-like protein [Natronolimnohabitans innermongolicus JCM 12255]